MQTLLGMLYVTMLSINSMSDKLVNKEDIESVKTELTRKAANETIIGFIKREI
jgi:hypothetical protein